MITSRYAWRQSRLTCGDHSACGWWLLFSASNPSALSYSLWSLWVRRRPTVGAWGLDGGSTDMGAFLQVGLLNCAHPGLSQTEWQTPGGFGTAMPLQACVLNPGEFISPPTPSQSLSWGLQLHEVAGSRFWASFIWDSVLLCSYVVSFLEMWVLFSLGILSCIEWKDFELKFWRHELSWVQKVSASDFWNSHISDFSNLQSCDFRTFMSLNLGILSSNNLENGLELFLLLTEFPSPSTSHRSGIWRCALFPDRVPWWIPARGAGPPTLLLVLLCFLELPVAGGARTPHTGFYKATCSCPEHTGCQSPQSQEQAELKSDELGLNTGYWGTLHLPEDLNPCSHRLEGQIELICQAQVNGWAVGRKEPCGATVRSQ